MWDGFVEIQIGFCPVRSCSYSVQRYSYSKGPVGKTNLKRIESMLTRLIQRSPTVSDGSIEYEREYRDAEYEYEERP